MDNPKRELSVQGAAIIGAGTMGEVLLRGLLEHGFLAPEMVTISDIDRDRLDALAADWGVRKTTDNLRAVGEGQLILLAVKPQVMEEVLSELAEGVSGDQIVFSIAAGVSTASIERGLKAAVPVVRIMPNTPCQVGAGVSALCPGSHAGERELGLAREVFSVLGDVVTVQEERMDAVTGLSGSGPAFVYVMIEALADGGVLAGLDRATAIALAAGTVRGAAEHLLESGIHPGRLKDMVASPAGTTITALSALERAGLRGMLMEAVGRAARRSRELGEGGG